MLTPELQEGYEQLRQLNIFDGVPHEVLGAALSSGGIQRRSFARDIIIADPSSIQNDSASICYVIQGQVAVAVFDAGELEQRRAEQQRRAQMNEKERQELSLLPPPPLARTAKKNLALFMEGDLFNAKSLASVAGDNPAAFYAVGPAVVAFIDNATMANLASTYPFFEARFRRAIESAYARLGNVTGVKQELLDFFVRQGISVAGPTVRVRQLDRCIDCKMCEKACEDRYGSKRLTLGGYQLGMIDFVYTCRTCSDQRCVSGCEYDSIKFDASRGEVVINEATCVGCTMCAQSCPFHAIEMVDIEDPSHPNHRTAFKARLDEAGSLKFGPGTGRVARPRRIANKCDHCVQFFDQACVSACPTSALIEISPEQLFRERSASARTLAEAGYDRDLRPDKKELLPTQPFTRGIGVKDGGKAKIRRGKVLPVICWALGLATFVLAVAEVVLRAYWPTRSLQYFWLMNDPNAVQGIILEKIRFVPGDELAMWCGYLGTLLMMVATAYPMMRRMKIFRRVAANTMYFDLHMMSGTVGPMFIVLHAAFKLDNWVALAFWAMVIVVLSGVIGRYLYTQVPDLAHGRDLEDLEHKRALADLRSSHPEATAIAEGIIAEHQRAAARVARNAGLMYALLWIVSEDVRRPTRWLSRRHKIGKSSAPKAVKRELIRRTGRMILLDRRGVLVSRAQLLLHSWKIVHVPFTILMVALSAIHIWQQFDFVVADWTLLVALISGD
ncbi:4Fe-4S dicluster domain-containing protein [Haliangium ochraceum]|nr:4Fe-4S dicluster domain-containing protein [Haliangium ochraceum]